MTKHLPWFAAIVLVEFVLAQTLSNPAYVPGRIGLAVMKIAEKFAPVVANFSALPDIYPGVPVYLGITVLLIPAKAVFYLL